VTGVECRVWDVGCEVQRGLSRQARSS